MLVFSQMFAGWCMVIAGLVCAKRAWSCSRKLAFKKHVPVYVVLAILALGGGGYIVISLISSGAHL